MTQPHNRQNTRIIAIVYSYLVLDQSARTLYSAEFIGPATAGAAGVSPTPMVTMDVEDSQTKPPFADFTLAQSSADT